MNMSGAGGGACRRSTPKPTSGVDIYTRGVGFCRTLSADVYTWTGPGHTFEMTSGRSSCSLSVTRSVNVCLCPVRSLAEASGLERGGAFRRQRCSAVAFLDRPIALQAHCTHE